MNNRAYAVLAVKAIAEDTRTITGIATTPTPDRVGDIIDPLGVKFAPEMPFLWQHDACQPIGIARFGTPTKDGIPFDASIAMVAEPGSLKDRLDEAWQTIKAGLVRAVSIGFRPIEYAFMDTGGIKYSATEVYELSAVTIPCNAEAVISAVKSFYREMRAALALPAPEIPSPHAPAAIGKAVRVVRLENPARDRADPVVINSIKRLKR